MAIIQLSFYAKSICRFTTVHIVLPNDPLPEMVEGNKHYTRPMKTLYLLHGYSGNSWDWLTGSLIQQWALEYNLAVIMPSGDNSCYLNGRGAGNAYETFIAVELVEYMKKTFGLSDNKEDNFIGGLSMGGFGAIHTALKYSDTYSKMFGLSAAMLIHRIEGMKPGEKDNVADYDYYESVFGDLKQLDTSDKNPEFLIKQRLEKGDTIQPIYMACGTEDFLLKQNRDFYQFLLEHKVDIVYQENKGTHDWKFWNKYLEPAICFLLE